MKPALHQTEDVFVLEADGDQRYLYLPLSRAVAVINDSAAQAVGEYLQNGLDSLSPAGRHTVQTLRSEGILGQPAAWPVFPQEYGFCPHEVTLFPTSRCNLRCRYCYADAGSRSIDMKWEVARAAVDFVARNAGLLGSPHFGVGFHGGGEPTLAWELLTRTVDHAHEKADALGLDVQVYAATNGLLSPGQRDYMVKNFTSVTVSLDGAAEIQDQNRPTVGGSGSYKTVASTLRFFREVGFRFELRATVTRSSVKRMAETVEHLYGEFGIHDLHIEPVWQCGRCLTTGEETPPDPEFVECYARAAQRGRELGVSLHYSGARLDMLTSKFCGAPGDSFTVLPEGLVTSCYEITDRDDPRAEVFHYGYYDAERGAFCFDHERLSRLRELSVEHFGFCRDCFCKWHCAGDCLAKVFLRSGGVRHEGSSRCQLNRALTRLQLEELVAAASGSDGKEG